MPRASKVQLSKDLANELFADLILILHSFTTSEAINSFMEELLTKEEKIMLSKRIAVYHMLYSGNSLRDIQQKLGMSDESIRIYNLKKHEKSDKFKAILLRLAGKKNKQQLVKSLEKKLKPLEYALTSKTNIKSRAKLLSGDFE